MSKRPGRRGLSELLEAMIRFGAFHGRGFLLHSVLKLVGTYAEDLRGPPLRDCSITPGLVRKLDVALGEPVFQGPVSASIFLLGRPVAELPGKP